MSLDSRIERDRHQALAGDVDRLPPAAPTAEAAVLVQTTTVSSYPTTSAVFFAANPVEIDAVETEGQSASFTADATQILYVLNVGTAVPPVGTRLIAHGVGGRWVIRYDG